jgi:uncharacterized protein (DUF433 family)
LWPNLAHHCWNRGRVWRPRIAIAEWADAMSRNIVRDNNVLSGRWRFEGTTIPIAAIRSDYQFGRRETKKQYAFMDLTDEEIDAALAFEFPLIRELQTVVEYASLTVNCVCGEDTHQAAVWPVFEIVDCICDRHWRVSVLTELVADGHDGHQDRAAGLS